MEILDTFKSTLGDLADIYGQIEQIKAERRLNDAKTSLYYATAPTIMQDAQARSLTDQQFQQSQQINPLILLGLGALLVYVIVK